QLVAELPGRIFAGDFTHAYAVESSIRCVILLNENRRIGRVETVAQPLGITAIPERSHLHGEKSRGGIHVAEDFHPHRRDPRPHLGPASLYHVALADQTASRARPSNASRILPFSVACS